MNVNYSQLLFFESIGSINEKYNGFGAPSEVISFVEPYFDSVQQDPINYFVSLGRLIKDKVWCVICFNEPIPIANELNLAKESITMFYSVYPGGKEDQVIPGVILIPNKEVFMTQTSHINCHPLGLWIRDRLEKSEIDSCFFNCLRSEELKETYHHE
jgi:hypothetical protein